MVVLWLLSMVSVLTSVVCHHDGMHYDGHSVWRVVPVNKQQLINLDEFLQQNQVDTWQDVTVIGGAVNFRVPPEHSDTWWTELERIGLQPTVVIPDIESLIKTERSEDVPSLTVELDTSRYYPLEEMQEWLELVADECTPGEGCTLTQACYTCEGRSVYTMKVGRPGGGQDKPAIWINGGLHAREWISPAVAMYVIDRLVQDDGVDDDVTTLLDHYDWFITVPVNPDGYDYTWTTDRMWRKTRCCCDGGGSCAGADGNRNFDFMWDVAGGASDNPCSTNYRGSAPASENCVSMVDEAITKEAHRVKMLIDLHSFGQILLYPWGYTQEEDPEDLEDLRDLAIIGVDAINAVHDAGYVHGQTQGIMSGNTMDWAKGHLGIKYSYTLELRDRGEFGFLLPPSQILPTDEEAWAGIMAMALEIMEE